MESLKARFRIMDCHDFGRSLAMTEPKRLHFILSAFKDNFACLK
ncbi:hypothetical protein [Helicobacter sp.]|nr:hypothetical protein [Helicobacter sp.]